MKVLPVQAGDFDALLEIQAECSLSPWTRDGYERELDRSDSTMLVAKDLEGHYAGFIAGRTPCGDELLPCIDAEIYNIGVRPIFRRRGVGSLLLNQFVESCIEKKLTEVWLDVRASNVGAIEFYRKHGFQREGTRPNFYRNPVEAGELMVLRLGNE